MIWGGWSIEREVLDYMVAHVPSDGLVVELGSGRASARLAEHFRLVSYEHDRRFLLPGDPPRWRVHYAPLAGGWYARDVVSATIPQKYDALLVDGPPTGARRLKMLQYAHLFDWTALVVIDDLHRGDEKRLAQELAGRVGRELKVIRCRQKSFGVL